MAYSDFTLNDIKRQFRLTLDETTDLFAAVREVAGSLWLTETLQETLPLALALHTEKSRSELLIAPILVELRKQARHQVGLFSGIDFSVDPGQGLNGVCDFLITRSPEQLFVSAPILIVVEAKNDNIKGGFAQCIAAMVAAKLFNDREGYAVPAVYGAITTGTIWRFLKLAADIVYLDLREYYINRVEEILGILLFIVGASEAIEAEQVKV
jgi:hypothetical protein